ncbi:hypothetical protein Plhal710r2_c024g0096581 [Plasmopara halstedii]
MLELALMFIVSKIFANDHRIQYLLGQPVEWIHAHNTRMLHPYTIPNQIRTVFGIHCIQQWSKVQWKGVLLDDQEALSELDGYYPDGSSVLQLRDVDDGMVMIAGGWTIRC